MQRHDDVATDLTVALVFGAGVAGCLGLALGGLALFRPLPVVLAGLAGVAGAFRALRMGQRRGGGAPREDGGATARLRTADGILVFALALALYAPGYDTTLYGADATAYLGSAAYLARHGAFRMDAPLLEQLPTVGVESWRALFPAYDLFDPTTRSRSLAGLAFDVGTRSVYSTFAKLPSVWLALGFGVAGIPGAVFMSPLLGASATMAYYLLLRRTLGMFVAVLAAGLLATCVPELIFARVSTGEIGGQFFLWGGLLALSRWYDSRAALAAVAAGVGLGCAMLARPELLVFIPLATLIAWMLGLLRGVSLLTVGAAVGLGGVALGLLVSLPTHYRSAVSGMLHGGGFGLMAATRSRALAAAFAAALAVAVVGAMRLGSPGGRPRWLRAMVGLGIGLWAIAYFLVSVPPGFFSGARLLPQYANWIVLLAGVVGLPVLARRWRGDCPGFLALLIGVVAAGHLLYDPHVLPLPLWAARRFVPAILPLLFAAAAVAIAWPRQRLRWVGAVLALAVVLSNARLSRALWHKPFLRGSEAAVRTLVEVLPEDAFVVLDPSLFGALLDVPLWLLHGREALQLTGVSGMALPVVTALALKMSLVGRPIYLVQHLFLPPPTSRGLVFTEVGTGKYPILALEVTDPPRTMLLALRVFRVEMPEVAPLPHG